MSENTEDVETFIGVQMSKFVEASFGEDIRFLCKSVVCGQTDCKKKIQKMFNIAGVIGLLVGFVQSKELGLGENFLPSELSMRRKFERSLAFRRKTGAISPIFCLIFLSVSYLRMFEDFKKKFTLLLILTLKNTRGLFLERFHVSKVTYLYVKFVTQRNTYPLTFLRAFLETICVKKFSK